MTRFRILLDIVDILLVAFLLYRVFLLIRGTRAAQMFFGLAVLMVTSIAAEIFGLDALNWIVANLKTVWVIAFVILFQPELRRALAVIGNHYDPGPIGLGQVFHDLSSESGGGRS